MSGASLFLQRKMGARPNTFLLSLPLERRLIIRFAERLGTDGFLLET